MGLEKKGGKLILKDNIKGDQIVPGLHYFTGETRPKYSAFSIGVNNNFER